MAMAGQDTDLHFHTVDLFGGAIQASLPTTFADVSDIRQVPDNQEVYLDKDGFTSIVFDILERVDAPSDQEALKVHLQDVFEEDVEQTRVWQTGEAHFAKLPPNTPAYTLLATSPPGAKQRGGRANDPDFVGIILTLVRLEAKETDIVISINVPHIAGQYAVEDVDPEEGKLGPLLEKARTMRGRVMETFEIKDWGLFV